MSCGCSESKTSSIIQNKVYVPDAPPCPDGYTLSGRNCIKSSQIPATATNTSNYDVFWSRPRKTWGTRGTVVMDSNLAIDELWTTSFWKNSVSPYPCCAPWDCQNCSGTYPGGPSGCSKKNCLHFAQAFEGPVNRSAVWNDSIPPDQWVGFSTCVDVEEETTLYVGMGTGYIRRIQVDGVVVADYDLGALLAYTDSLDYWFEANYFKDLDVFSIAAAYQTYQIIPITISAGVHRLDFITQAPPAKIFNNTVDLICGEGIYTGGLAVDVYNCPLSVLRNATANTDILQYRIFSSSMQIGQKFNYVHYTCPAGFEKIDDSCSETPVCEYTDIIPANIPASVDNPDEPCVPKDFCEDPIPTDCVIYSEGTIACSDEINELHPMYTSDSPATLDSHYLVEEDADIDQRTLTAILKRINTELSYIFSKDFITNVLNATINNTDLNTAFAEVVCEGSCDCEPPVYRPHFINSLNVPVDIEVGIIVGSDYNHPAPVELTLYNYNNITLPVGSDVVAVTTPINTQANWICITLKNTNAFGIFFDIRIEDNDGNVVAGSFSASPSLNAGDLLSDYCGNPIPYILPYSDDYNIIIEAKELL